MTVDEASEILLPPGSCFAHNAATKMNKLQFGMHMSHSDCRIHGTTLPRLRCVVAILAAEVRIASDHIASHRHASTINALLLQTIDDIIFNLAQQN